ncbi:MAG: hypothetical protein LBU53_07415 [Zoogloeaceae bacterium]|jgi:hypothetical protein|nr:hypothetical protein [Zoogloeaceae bacterium]
MMAQTYSAEYAYLEKFGRWPPSVCMGFMSDGIQNDLQQWAIENNTPIPEDEDAQDALIRKLFPKVGELLDDPNVLI